MIYTQLVNCSAGLVGEKEDFRSLVNLNRSFLVEGWLV